MAKRAPSDAQKQEQLRRRFHTVTAPTQLQPERGKSPPPSKDEQLANTLATYLGDDRAKFLILWLDQEGRNANQRAHMNAVNNRDQKYSLGQESAFQIAARKLREIRGEL